MPRGTMSQVIGSALANAGIVVPGEIHVLMRSGAYQTYPYWTDKFAPDRQHTSLTTAESLMTTNRNDVLLVAPESHSLAASLTWNLNMTHLIGSYQGGPFNVRNRIGMSTTFTPMITVSGYGNIFANLYTMHGTAATDLVGWLISGNRNTFRNVHFGGPMNTAQGGHASYIGVNVTGAENYFEGCTFGTSTIGRDEVSPNVKVGPNSRTVFKDCLFQVYLTDGDPVFVTMDNSDTCEAWFINCKFVALNANWATAMTKAFHFTGGATAGVYLDEGCHFINVSALSAADKDQFIWLPRTHSTTTDTQGQLNVQLTI